MNAQQIFDTVARHLLTQRRKSQDAMGNCLYRGPDGMKCAAGILIPDEEYSPELETKYVENPLVWSATGIDDETHRPLIRSLQFMHDDDKVEDWPDELERIASEHRISSRIVAELAPEGKWHPATSPSPAPGEGK